MKVLDIQTKVLKFDKTEFLLNKTFLSSPHDYWEQQEKIFLSWISRKRNEHEVNGDLAVGLQGPTDETKFECRNRTYR